MLPRFLVYFWLLIHDLHPVLLVHVVEPEVELDNVLKAYNPNRRPQNACNETLHQPTVLHVNVHVDSFSSFSVIHMDFTMDFLLRQRWQDPRLQLQSLEGNETLSIGYERQRIWLPDLYFKNAKDGRLHTVTKPNYLIWLDAGAEILFVQKLSVTFSCPMNLWKFPLDKQRCLVEVGSFGYSKSELEFHWWSDHHLNLTDAFDLSDSILLNEFYLPHVVLKTCDSHMSQNHRFSCLVAELIFERKLGFYVIYTYLPSFLVIIVSWTQFLIDQNAVPGRISLGLLSVVALMTQTAATVSHLPKVSYVKAIDLWLFVCLAFVVSSMVEFALVNSLNRRAKLQKWNAEFRQAVQQEVALLTKCNGDDLLDSHDLEMKLRNGVQMKYHEERSLNGQMVDNIFLVAFPIGFLLFNLFYWVFYLFVSDE